MRYRSAAIAEFMRALRTLKALQVEQAATLDFEAAALRPGSHVRRRVSLQARTNPVLRECGMEVGRPPRARGGRAGSEIGTNPGRSPPLSRIRPRFF